MSVELHSIQKRHAFVYVKARYRTHDNYSNLRDTYAARSSILVFLRAETKRGTQEVSASGRVQGPMS